MISIKEEIEIKRKQDELGLSNDQCDKILKYLLAGFTFTEQEVEFEGYVLDFLEKKGKDKK